MIDNRESFGRDGPGHITGPHSFRVDQVTEAVCDLVEQTVFRSSGHTGTTSICR